MTERDRKAPGMIVILWMSLAVLAMILTACAASPGITVVPSATTTPGLATGLTPTRSPAPPSSVPGSTQFEPTPLSSTTIAHMNPGERVVVSEIHMVDRSNGWAIYDLGYSGGRSRAVW